MRDLSRYMTLFNARLVEAARTSTKTQTKSAFDTGTIGQTKVNAPAISKPKATLKKASQAKTRSATQSANLGAAGPQAMRHMMDLASNLDQIDTSQEQDLDVDQGEGYNEPVPTTPENLPAVINQDVMAQGKVEPEWHMVKNLPGYISKPIRAMGRQLFRAFTSTPIEDVNVVANLMGGGPNSKREINAIAGTVNKMGRRMTEAEIEFESVMPGYSASTKIYEYKGYVFMLVQDFAGQYVYSWPAETNLLGND